MKSHSDIEIRQASFRDGLLFYDMGPGVRAFSTCREAELPYHVVQPHQTHGCTVVEVKSPMTTREDLEGVDALVTDVPGLAVGVRTADCIPVLLYDPVRKAVAAVHAGWRGTVQRISQAAIGRMTELYGTCPSDLKAVIGPGIGPDSFQVGQEVADAFLAAGFPQDLTEDRGPKGTDMAGGLHIDLWRANRWLLEQAGVNDIHVAGICTYAHNDLFFSARREGTKCGRIINAVRLDILAEM